MLSMTSTRSAIPLRSRMIRRSNTLLRRSRNALLSAISFVAFPQLSSSLACISSLRKGDRRSCKSSACNSGSLVSMHCAYRLNGKTDSIISSADLMAMCMLENSELKFYETGYTGIIYAVHLRTSNKEKPNIYTKSRYDAVHHNFGLFLKIIFPFKTELSTLSQL